MKYSYRTFISILIDSNAAIIHLDLIPINLIIIENQIALSHEWSILLWETDHLGGAGQGGAQQKNGYETVTTFRSL